MRKIEKLRNELDRCLIDREQEIDLLLVGLLSGEHVLLIGPVGCAKTELASNLKAAVKDVRVFKYLLAADTEPSEVFGPVTIPTIKRGGTERSIEGYAPDSHIFIPDEIWKGCSTLNHGFLSMVNERVYHNGGQEIDVPLRMMVGCSNEWPDNNDFTDQTALFDRFLLRTKVSYISPLSRNRLMYEELPKPKRVISLAELDRERVNAQKLPISAEVKATFRNILADLTDSSIVPGDRRLRKAVSVVKAAAYLAGARSVRQADLEVLKYALWTQPEQIGDCAMIVRKHANPNGLLIDTLNQELDEIILTVDRDSTTATNNLPKIKEIENRAKAIKNKCEKAKELLTRVEADHLAVFCIANNTTEEEAAEVIANS